MKPRMCKKCKKEIEGVFVKCCRSDMISKKSKSIFSGNMVKSRDQKLTKLGDLHLDCWEEIVNGR